MFWFHLNDATESCSARQAHCMPPGLGCAGQPIVESCTAICCETAVHNRFAALEPAENETEESQAGRNGVGEQEAMIATAIGAGWKVRARAPPKHTQKFKMNAVATKNDTFSNELPLRVRGHHQ